MSRFRNLTSGVVVSVSDEKDDRFVNGWESADAETPKRGRPAKKSESDDK